MSGFANSLIGLSLGGYTIQRMIARGGMGIVYEGIQESLGRRVAVKVLYPHLGEDESFRERFQREARAIAHLRHPNIVGVIDFGSDQGYHFMVMDLIDGHSLRDELSLRHEQGRPFSVNESLLILEKIAAALTYAHSRGLVHRDVKPANVMLDRDGSVYLTDFGLVKLADAQNVTIAGMIVGTPEYMAPEQSAGMVDVTPAADQYSLAVVAYQLLVGRVPFTAPTPVGVIQKHLSEPPPPPSTIVPTFPKQVEDVLMRALSKEPGDRYPSVDWFFRELRQDAQLSFPTSTVVATPAPEAELQITPEPIVTAPTVATPVTSGPVHDPGGITRPTPVVAAAQEPAVTRPLAATGTGSTAGASAAVAQPAGSGAGGFVPPSTALPAGGDAAGGRRIPLIAAIIALALVLGIGGIAAASIFRGNDDDPALPAAAVTSTAAAEHTATALAEATSQMGLIDPTATPTETASQEPTPTEAAPTSTPDIAPTPTDLPTQPPAQVTPTQIRRLPPTPTPFVINPVTPTFTPTPVMLGEVTGPAAEVELRNYMSVPTWIELVGLGSFVVQPGEYTYRMLPAGTWQYIQSAEGYTSLEGEITWNEGGRYFWEFYDGDEVEIVEIQNNLEVPMTLEFDGWGELYVAAGNRVTRVFPAGEYEYSFYAEGYNSYTSTVVMEAGARTTWPFSPS